MPAPRYTFTYPDGPHDAETLLVHPRTGRLFVVTKSVFGGTVYAAPGRPRAGGQPNRLKAFARVTGLVTDGTFLPDGRRVVLRTYGTATVYTFPGFAPIGTVGLPQQRQGEGISVSRTGRVLVSSEGPAQRRARGEPAGGADRARGDPVGRAAWTRRRPTRAHRARDPARPWTVSAAGAGPRWSAARWRRAGLPDAQRRSTTWSTQAVSASTSAGSMAGNIATRSWLRPSLR